MSYTALYRKFRPDTFEDVKGQDHIVTTLKNQIRGRTVSVTHFCSVEPVEPVRRPWQRSLRKRSIVSSRWMEVPVTNVRPVKRSRREHP